MADSRATSEKEHIISMINTLPYQLIFDEILSLLNPELIRELDNDKQLQAFINSEKNKPYFNLLWKKKLRQHFPDHYKKIENENKGIDKWGQNYKWDKEFWEIYNEQYERLSDNVKLLFSLTKENDVENVAKILNASKDLNELYRSDKMGFTLYLIALKNNNYKILDVIYKNLIDKLYKQPSNKIDRSGRSLIDWSILCMRPIEEIRENFINNNPNLQRAFLNCCISGRKELIPFLLEKGLNINDEFEGTTPLYIALEYRQDDIFNFLIEKNADPNTTFRHDSTVLSMAIEYNVFDKAEYILEHCQNLSKETLNKALKTAAKSPHCPVSLFELLIKKGADNYFEKECIFNAFEHNSAIANYILDKRAAEVKQELKDMNNKTLGYYDDLILFILDRAENPDIDLLKKIINNEEFNVNSISDRDLTPVMLAAYKQKTEILELFINKGGKIDSIDDGRSPLMYAISAISNYDIKKVQLLLDKGAEINYVTRLGNTALIDAVDCVGKPLKNFSEAKGTIQLLLEKGADVNAKNNNDQTPFYYSIKRCKYSEFLSPSARQSSLDIARLLLGYRALSYINDRSQKGEYSPGFLSSFGDSQKDKIDAMIALHAILMIDSPSPPLTDKQRKVLNSGTTKPIYQDYLRYVEPHIKFEQVHKISPSNKNG